MSEMKIRREEQMNMLVDSKSALSLAKHPITNGRSKHIQTKFHLLRNQVSKGKLEVKHCSTNELMSDILAKPLKADQFKLIREKTGLLSTANMN